MSGALTINTPATISSDAGLYSLTPSGLSSSNYNLAYTSGELAVTPAPLTITANNPTKEYGEFNPIFTAHYNGFKLGQDESVLTGSLSLSTIATQSSDVGNYTINPTGLTSNNYLLNYMSGQLQVTPATLNVTVNPASRLYGDINPAFNVAYSGFKLAQDESVLNGTLNFLTPATITSDVGVYAISASGLTSNNYTLNYTSGAFAVTPAPLTVATNNTTKLYGDVNPTLSASYSGFKLGQDESVLNGTLNLATTATQNSDVGLYTIQANGLSSGNYDISYMGGVMSVTPAPLSVIVNNESRVYGDLNPVFSASYSGFKLAQDESVLDGSLDLATMATTASDVGSYTINGSGLNSTNYTLAYTNGQLMITPAPLLVAVQNASRLQGSPNPIFTTDFSGFKLADDASSLLGTLSFLTPATFSASPGVYPVMPMGLNHPNYTITFVDGELSVLPRPVTNNAIQPPFLLNRFQNPMETMANSPILVASLPIAQQSSSLVGQESTDTNAASDSEGKEKKDGGQYAFIAAQKENKTPSQGSVMPSRYKTVELKKQKVPKRKSINRA